MNSSCTWRELSAAIDVLCSFIDLIERKVVKHGTDCENVIRILTSGSKKFDLQILECNIFKHSTRSEWISRNENWNPDFISKDIDRDDHMKYSLLLMSGGPSLY